MSNYMADASTRPTLAANTWQTWLVGNRREIPSHLLGYSPDRVMGK